MRSLQRLVVVGLVAAVVALVPVGQAAARPAAGDAAGQLDALAAWTAQAWGQVVGAVATGWARVVAGIGPGLDPDGGRADIGPELDPNGLMTQNGGDESDIGPELDPNG
jgi:hypothetical protein